jgi:aminoglycoside 6'-N-acetyltransferase
MNGIRAGLEEVAMTPAPMRARGPQVKRSVDVGATLSEDGSGMTSPVPLSSIELRPATIADAPLLREWDEEPDVVASDPNDEWNWETELARTPEWREQLIATVDGRPLGFVQIIDPAREESRYWGDAAPNLRAIDIWIGEARDRGKGYGAEVMRLALARCFAAPEVTAVLIDPLASNTRSHRFYERLGFRFLERRQFGADDCLVYRLSREDWLSTARS